MATITTINNGDTGLTARNAINNSLTNLNVQANSNTSRISDLETKTADGDKGDVTVSASGATWTIDNEAVTFGKIQNISQDHLIGRNSAGTGSPEALSATQVRALLNVEDGADVTDTANVTAAGALMDSEVVNLDQVKAFNSADYATAAQGALASSALQSGDNVSSLTNDAGYLTTSTGQKKASRQTLTDGATVDWNVANGNIGVLTLGGNRTINAPTNLYDDTFVLILKQDATGSRTVTWNAIFKWSEGTPPTLSTAANAVDIVTFIYDGTNLYGSTLTNFS